jgi:hypothetical protein
MKDENTGSYESLRDAKMPVVKDIRCPDSSYYSKDIGGSTGYLARKDKIASSDSAKLKKGKVGM